MPIPVNGSILVTGGGGQVATAIVAAAGKRKLRRVGRPEFDFDAPDGIARLLRAEQPAIVVNAAAYTAVDAAEGDAAAADRGNRTGPALIAAYCAEAGIPLIHISTDYVYDGRKGAPYVETDPTNPTGVYGSTKLAGEAAVLAANPRTTVLRTSWVYAPWGKNFVRTMLNLGATRDTLGVVADQVGCPTAATDLAVTILAICDRIASEGWQPAYRGIFHAAGTGATSWHGLASAVFEVAERHGQTRPTVAALTTADYPTKARRPADSRLDCGKLAAVFGERLPDWRETLAETVDTIFLERQRAAPAPAGV